MSEPKSVQRSFRLSARTLELLDAAAAHSRESRNAMADRLLGEAVRVERHPLIRFHAGAAGRRKPRVVGTRLDVHQVMATLRANDADVEATAEYLGVDPRLVRAALDYYAEFTDEVDADTAVADQVAETERERWERAAAGDPLRLALDHHYSPAIAFRLREASHDAVAAIERGWEREEDESLLAICAEGRALLTNDVADFTALCRAWAADGRSHAGVIFTSDTSMPRSRRTVGRFVDALDDLLRQHPEEDAFRDRVHWL